MTANLTFHAAAECVTGSCMLLESSGRRILIDRGLDLPLDRDVAAPSGDGQIPRL